MTRWSPARVAPRGACAVVLLAGVLRAQNAHLVTGRIDDADHRPVVGALVGVRAHLDSPYLVSSSDAGDTPWLAGVFARSGAGGTYRIALPADWAAHADSALDLVVVAVDFAPYVAPLDPAAATSDAVLTPAIWHTYRFTARTPAGRPARQAVMRAVVGVGDSVVERVTADAAGRLTWRAPTSSPLVVRVTTPGYRPVETAPFDAGDTAKSALTVTLLPAITGTVRDERGLPAAGVGVFWYLASEYGFAQTTDAWKEWLARPGWAARTDQAGRFVMAPPMTVDAGGALFNGRQAAGSPTFDILAADSVFTRLAFARVDAQPRGATRIAVRVTVHRTREVRVPILVPARVSARSRRRFGVSVEGASRPRPRHLATAADTAAILVAKVTLPDSSSVGDAPVHRVAVFHLPPGRYRTLANRWPEVKDARGSWFDVPPGTAPVTVTEQRPHPLPLYALLGKPAPEIDATDLDGTPVHLRDFRGKVVVLDFWGYWCGPCIARFKSHVIPLAEHFAGQSVVVLGLHDASIRTRAEFDSVFRPVERRELGRQDLPFPVLLDQPTPAERPQRMGDRQEGTGVTTATYNVTMFPSLFLIDPRGVLVEAMTLEPEGVQEEVDRLLRGSRAGNETP